MNNLLNKINHYVEIKIETTNSISTLKTMYNLNIGINNTKYFKKYIIIKISYSDYLKINKFIKCKIIKHYNIFGLIRFIKQNIIQFMSLFSVIILTFLLSNIILDIKIIHTNPNIREIIERELKDYNIKKYTLKKSYKKINYIKNNIIKNNPETIEWIEIENVGMTYIIRVEERILTNKNENKSFCNLVASKNGLIKRYYTSKGESLIEENKYVNKGDILISGTIKFNEETKGNVCASGKVYANTWYTINLKIPLEYTNNKPTGKIRYNIKFKNKDNEFLLFKPRLKEYITKEKQLLSIFNHKMYLTRDIEIKKEPTKYTDEEIESLVNKEINEKFKNLLKQDYKIVSKKVLKKEVKNSIIDIDIFIVIEENIAITEKYEIIE